jgi:hypothetical protein
LRAVAGRNRSTFRAGTFTNYLIGRDGCIAEPFPETVEPTAITRALMGTPDTRSAAELTGSTDKSSTADKAVAVAAQLQLGYHGEGQEWLGRRQKAAAGHGISVRGIRCVLRQV